MEQINLNAAELLEKLEHNLELHKKVYKETMAAFKENYIKKVTSMLKDAEDDKFEFNIGLQKPENHEQDYKNAIKMVKMDCREVIILSESEFRTYILNQWNWVRSFHMSYLSNSRGYSGISGFSGYSSDAQEYFGDSADES